MHLMVPPTSSAGIRLSAADACCWWRFATFIVLRLTGNPVDIFLDINRTPEQVQALTQRLHLDQPLADPVPDLPARPAARRFRRVAAIQRIPPRSWCGSGSAPRLQLAGAGLGVAVVLGVLGGIACAVSGGTGSPDTAISSIAVAGQSMPSFWLGHPADRVLSRCNCTGCPPPAMAIAPPGAARNDAGGDPAAELRADHPHRHDRPDGRAIRRHRSLQGIVARPGAG